MSASLTYVYCLVRSTRRPPLPGVPDGMPGASDVRAIDAGGGLRAIVSTVPARDYDEAALANGLLDMNWVGTRAIAHEAVVEHFLAAPAVLPMQLFTLFTSDERALEHVARERRRIDRILSKIEKQLEWGLRLTFDEKAARAAVDEQYATAQASGAEYLVRKRDLLDVTRAQLAAAKSEADRLYRAMSREATEARRRKATEEAAPGARLLLDAAFLVPAQRSGAFRSALRRHARTLGGIGIVVSLTGPWPAYNFINSPSRQARGDRTAKRPARRGASAASRVKTARDKPARRPKRAVR